MFNLIIKDILIQKKSVLIVIAFCVFILGFMYSGVNNLSFGGYSAGIVGSVYILVFTAVALDEKDNSYIMLNSLPLKRSDLVLARYLSVIIILIFVCIIITITGFTMQWLPLKHKPGMIGATEIILSFISITLMVSVYFPLVYKFGSQNLRLLGIALLMLAFFAPGLFSAYTSGSYNIYQLSDYFHSSASPVVIGGLSLILAGFILLLSYIVSLQIYLNKDL